MSILMLYSALAIMLGHSFIPHHHHFEERDVSHHHDEIPHNHDSEDESSDWGQLFANFNHATCGLIFFTSHTEVDSYTKERIHTSKLLCPAYFIQHAIIDFRQNAPPYISAFYNSHLYLPYGLRAPPFFIV